MCQKKSALSSSKWVRYGIWQQLHVVYWYSGMCVCVCVCVWYDNNLFYPAVYSTSLYKSTPVVQSISLYKSTSVVQSTSLYKSIPVVQSVSINILTNSQIFLNMPQH